MPAFTGKLRLMVLVLWVSCVFIFCEYVIYFPTILRCSWPEMTDHKDFRAPLRALFLSDTHLLGAIRGHWFDKLRREWQMERAFQTALWLLKPEVVFILGDIFDEGKWSSPKDWEDDVRRFKQIFRHPSDMELVVLIGNHDIGFHHEMTRYKLERFEKVFNLTSARIITKRGVNFLLVNSVALHGDHCPICKSVESELHHLSQALNCSVQATHASSSPSSHQQSHNAGGERHRCKDVQKYASSPPVILQHYPLYRASDSKCTGVDAAPPNERYKQFHERYDVLSQDASKMLLWWFQPRLILSGHTHSGCEFLHENRFPEVSVPSFSWRNRNNPSFILGSFSQSDFALSKCFLPEESSVIAVYCGSVLVIALITLSHLSVFRRALRLANRLLGKQKSI
ncbi:metallophosphoesterase 1 isoform X2 [Electrophorus electricus]|uniref:metallophosphoesterase 1 isoform X2 n=1 Tax=Electrophorus electricus TaxID=8005 RepID=UPI0015D0AD61|nr:metallophosphoesterase 1 isoform X2 [Electrophorus electricus]